MSATSSQAAAGVGSEARGGWLHGPVPDWLLGAGAGYLLSVPVLLVLGRVSDLRGWPVAAAALFGLLISGPHYGATILRVYEQREDRRKYALFAVWVTLALCGLFVFALRDAWIGSLLVTAYATWSPWHFSGQNYGLAVMFLRRRGIPVEPRAKRLLYASFVLSCGLALLVLHGGDYGVSVSAVPVSGNSVFRFLSLGIPAGVLAVAVPVTALAYALTLAAAARLLLRHARPADLGPAASLVLVQALWFAVPGAMRVLTDVPPSGLAFAVVWVSACHAAQYLWVTSYYAQQQDPSLGVVPYLGRALFAGSAVTILPAFLFAPGLLGRVPWDLGLAILVFSVVNLHHFILDGAIWKLRDGRVARFLLRDALPAPTPTDTGRPGSSWLRGAVVALGVAALAIAGFDLWQREFVINRAEGDMDRVLEATRRLGWIGRDGPPLHTQVGNVFANSGRPADAIAEYRRSLELYPTASAWVGLGRVHAIENRWEDATEAFAAAVAESPDDPIALVHLGHAWLERGRPDRARPHLERARALAPGNPAVQHELSRLAQSRS
jgi:cytochrome c-type biogenesis protein CcmH/NrfG